MIRRFRHAPGAAAFALVGALPAALILAGAAFGGGWLAAALAWIALAGPAADSAIARAFPDADPGRADPLATPALMLLALCALAVLLAALAALSGGTLGAAGRIALFLSAGMYLGQVGHAVAHELIHRGTRLPFAIGAGLYTVLLFGHHVSAHRLVHHRHVATPADPNSAPLGMGFWRFAPRAWLGSFRQGLAAERRLRGHAGPYRIWIGGALASLAGVALAFGPVGLADYLGLCLYAQMQILLSDYVQHYGLSRRSLPDGRPEPVGPRHAWDSPHPLSSLMLANAPRHADHHMNPTRAYPALALDLGTPRPLMPWPIGVMAAAALVPPLWRRLMDRRAARMQAG